MKNKAKIVLELSLDCDMAWLDGARGDQDEHGPTRKWLDFGHDFSPHRFFGQKFRATGNLDVKSNKFMFDPKILLGSARNTEFWRDFFALILA